MSKAFCQTYFHMCLYHFPAFCSARGSIQGASQYIADISREFLLMAASNLCDGASPICGSGNGVTKRAHCTYCAGDVHAALDGICNRPVS